MIKNTSYFRFWSATAPQ